MVGRHCLPFLLIAVYMPTLHQSIVQKNIQALEQALCQSPFGWKEKNSLGFDALEMCQLLNFKEGEKLLHKTTPRIKTFDKQIGHYINLTPLEFEKKFRIHYFPTLRFADYDSFKETLCNSPLTYKFLLEKIPQIEGKIQTNTLPSLGIKWIDSTLGYGVFTTHFLKPGTLIGEYTGYVRRLYRTHPDTNPYCFHYPSRFFSFKYFVIDASLGGNTLRFINHSDQPNLTPAWVLDRDLLHLIFLTLMPIEPNSQLTVNYGSDFWKSRNKIEIPYNQ